MKYEAIAHYVNAELTCETNELEVLMNFLCKHETTHCDVIDGFTGEILCITNNPNGEDYMEDTFMYTVIGWSVMGE